MKKLITIIAVILFIGLVFGAWCFAGYLVKVLGW